MNCLQCQSETPNPKFCSRSCSATYNNIKNPKRKPEGKCAKCGDRIKSQWTYCGNCFDKKSVKNKTLGELKSKGNANSFGYPTIRQDSRRTYKKSGQPLSCKVCNYDIHVDICHIKDIQSFDDDTLISDINDIANLVALCKNHHWEFDHGYLALSN